MPGSSPGEHPEAAEADARGHHCQHAGDIHRVPERWGRSPAALAQLHAEDGPHGGGGLQTQRQVLPAGALQGHQW